MYCKHCGSPLKQGYDICSSCGAHIDFRDGGQSYFEDWEIKEWGNNDFSSKISKTKLPATELLDDDIDDDYDDYDDYESDNTLLVPSMSEQNYQSKRRSSRINKGQKKSNKEILIGSVLISVFVICIIAAALYLIKPWEPKDDDSKIAVSQNSNGNDNSTDKDTKDAAKADSENETKKDEKDEKAEERDTRHIASFADINENVKIYDKDNKVIEIKHKIYKVDNVIYIPFDDFMPKMGYKYNKNNENNGNEDEVGFYLGNKLIEVVIEKNDLIIYNDFDSEKGKGKPFRNDKMAYKVYNDDDNAITYVPAEEFLTKCQEFDAEFKDGNIYLK